MRKIFDLPVCGSDRRKSFYGKAKVIATGDEISLKSYDTIVCCWNEKYKTFTKIWNGYSATTMRHINCFLRYIGFMCGGKKWWMSLEPGKEYTINEFLNI